MVQTNIEIDLSKLDAWTAELEDELANAVAKAASHLERGAKINAPIDTGFLASSIHVQKEGRFEAVVVVGAEYGLYVEYGHLAKRNTTRMSWRGKSKKGNDRLTAQRISDKAFGTFVQGRFFMTRAAAQTDPYFQNLVLNAVRKAGSKL
jgi:hypothetical protein